MASLGHVFRVGRFHLLGRRAIFMAIVTLVAGFVAIGAELERPWRMLVYVVLTPNLTSPIWWMGTLYGLELVFLVAELLLLGRAEMARKSREFAPPVSWVYAALALGRRDVPAGVQSRDRRLARLAGAGGVAAAIAATSTLGAVFGLLEARPFWYGPYMPIYLLLSALVSGSAVLVLLMLATARAGRRGEGPEVAALVGDLGRLMVLFLGALLFLLALRAVVGLYGQTPGTFEALMLLLNGPLSLLFWGVEVLLGIALPFLLLLNPRTRSGTGVGVASLLVLAGLFAARYDFIIAGQLVPIVGGTGPLNYMPSATEAIIVAGVFALCALLYTMGERTLALGEGEH